MKIKNIVVAIILLLGITNLVQAQVILKGSLETGAPGETVCIKIGIEGISEIVAAQFIIETDTDLLSFKEFKNFNLPGLSTDNFNESAPGILRFAWVDPSTFGTAIEGSDILYEVCYEIVSAELTTTNVLFSEIENVLEIELAQNATDIFGLVEIELDHGKVIINNGNAPNFAIRIDHRSGLMGSNICVDVIAEEVLNVISQQYAITYDPDILSFTGIESGAMDLSPDMFNANIASGIISISWIEMNLVPLFLEPEEKMYQLCFDLIGSEGESAALEFEDVFDQIEIGDANLNTLNPILSPGSLTIDFASGLSDILTVNVYSENGLSHNEEELTIRLNGEELTQESTQQYNSAANAVISGSNLLSFYQNPPLSENDNAWSTLDLVLGIKMILEQINHSAISAISLDLDESGGLNLNDFSLLRKVLLQEPGIEIQPYFYIEQEQALSSTIDIYNFGNFNEYSFEGIAQSNYNLNFTAYKKGSASSYLFQSDELEDRSPVTLSFNDVYLEQGKPTIIELQLEDLNQKYHAIKGGLFIEDGSIEIVQENLNNDFSFYQATDQSINFLYASPESEEDFKLKLIVKTNVGGKAANLLKQASYIKNELVYEDYSIATVALKGRVIETSAEDQINLELMPNPFFENLRIKIPEKYMDGALHIYSTEGKEILSRKIVSNDLMLDRSVLGPDAIYYVRVTKGTSNETIKLISKTIN